MTYQIRLIKLHSQIMAGRILIAGTRLWDYKDTQIMIVASRMREN